MPAGRQNFVIEQRANFSAVITWRDSASALVNLTGYTARMDINQANGTLVLTLSTANGRISLGGAAGTITMTIAAADTAALTPGTYPYDLTVTSGGGTITRILDGVVTVDDAETQV